MASTPAFGPCLRRHAWSSIQAPCRNYQRRWARVHDVRFNATHQRPNRILERYKEKLDQKVKEKGLKNVEELKRVYSDEIQQLRSKAIVPGANAPLQQQQAQQQQPTPPPTPEKITSRVPFQAPPPPQPQTPQIPKSNNGVKTLSSFLDVEKTAALPAREIEALWRLRHVRDPQSLCAVMPSKTYARIAANARKHPQFILPLPREGQGAEIHFLQWTFPSPTTATVLFTHLAEFKLRGEFAQPHTTVTHHLDFLERGNVGGGEPLVVMEGRVMENRGVSVEEGRWLLMCLQKFYGFEVVDEGARAGAERRKRLMEKFSGGDEGFKVEELLEEAERVP